MFGRIKFSRVGDEIMCVVHSSTRDKQLPSRTPLTVFYAADQDMVEIWRRISSHVNRGGDLSQWPALFASLAGECNGRCEILDVANRLYSEAIEPQ